MTLPILDLIRSKIAEVERKNAALPPMPGYTDDESCALIDLATLRVIETALLPAQRGEGDLLALAEAAINAAHKWGMCQATYTTDDDEREFKNAVAALKDAIAALPRSTEGWVMVPREPTTEMVRVGTDARWKSACRDANSIREIWRAMIAAAHPQGGNPR